jgi:hypothetical protein
MKSCLLLAATPLLIGGCRSIVFTEEDCDQVQIVDAGSAFSVSLSSKEYWRNPKLKGSILEFLSHRYYEPDGPHVYEFRADRAGETQIRFPVEEGSESPEDLILRVKVIPDAVRGEMTP